MAGKLRGSRAFRIAITAVLLVGLLGVGASPAAACSADNVEQTYTATTDENGDGEIDTAWYLYEYEDGAVCLETTPILEV